MQHMLMSLFLRFFIRNVFICVKWLFEYIYDFSSLFQTFFGVGIVTVTRNIGKKSNFSDF